MLTEIGKVIMKELGVKDEATFEKMIKELRSSNLFTEEEVTRYLNGIIFTGNTDNARKPTDTDREMDD